MASSNAPISLTRDQDFLDDLVLLISNGELLTSSSGFIGELEQGDGQTEYVSAGALAEAVPQLVEGGVEALVDADGKGLHLARILPALYVSDATGPFLSRDLTLDQRVQRSVESVA